MGDSNQSNMALGHLGFRVYVDFAGKEPHKFYLNPKVNWDQRSLKTTIIVKHFFFPCKILAVWDLLL